MEFFLVGMIVWLWLRLRAVQAQARAQASPEVGVLGCEVGSHLYWLRDGTLVRAPVVRGVVHAQRAAVVNPLETDVDPATLVDIIDALERVDGRRAAS